MASRRYGARPGQLRGFGRVPRDLDEVVAYVAVLDEQGRRTGEQRAVTLIERAVDAIRYGGTIREAAARCGVHVSTFYDWRESGVSARADVLNGRRTLGQLTKAERMHVQFDDRLTEAEAERAMLLTGLAFRLAQGIERQTTRRKRVGGEVVEEVLTSETAEPDMRAIQWLAAVTDPERFGTQRVELSGTTKQEHSGPDGGPIPYDVRVSQVLERVRALKAADHADGANGQAPEPAETP